MAWASMLCKYVRELCMRALNGFWSRQVHGLKPTAGYYQDGKRFLADIEQAMHTARVRPEMLVRSR